MKYLNLKLNQMSKNIVLVVLSFIVVIVLLLLMFGNIYSTFKYSLIYTDISISTILAVLILILIAINKIMENESIKLSFKWNENIIWCFLV